MLTCMPTRLCPAAVSHLANATPCLESAPHNRELCCCHPMHVTGPTVGRACSGHRRPISCPVSRVRSPQTTINPHTFTALTPYCKSPYPHCSAPTASEHEKFSPRSTADTALEICTRDLAPMDADARTIHSSESGTLRAAISNSFKFRRSVNTRALPNSPAARL
jgi:hypothetical protein